MRQIFGNAPAHPADTPPDGDFARYVEALVERQARALAGGQQIAQVSQQPQMPQQPGRPVQSVQGRALPLSAKESKGVKAAKEAAQGAVLPSWHDTRQATKTAERRDVPPLPGAGPTLTRLLISIAVAAAIGLFSVLNIRWGPALATLLLLFAAAQGIRRILGGLKGRK